MDGSNLSRIVRGVRGRQFHHSAYCDLGGSNSNLSLIITSPLTFAAYGKSFRLSEHGAVYREAHRPRNRLLATNNGMPQKSSIPPALRRADDYLTTNAAQRRQRAREKALPAFCTSDKLVQKRQRITPGRRFGLDV